MGCNCGKASNTNEVHIYTDDKGKQTSYPTLTQAKAAKVRNQNRGTVRTERK